MLDICLLGTGGMMPLPYRWLTSMMARCAGSNLLIDCGEGTQIALKEKGWSPKPIDVICYPLPRRPYQRPSRASSDYGKCRAHRTADTDWTKGIRACGKCFMHDRSGTSI